MNWPLATNFLIALMAIANPLVKVPLWIEASQHDRQQVRWRLALLVTLAGGLILWIFLLLGDQILTLFGIDLASFRIAGGIVILMIGISMLNGRAVNVELEDLDESQSPFVQAKLRFRQVIVPMVMPMIAGPGSITTVIIYGTRASTVLDYAMLTVVLAGVIGLIFVTLLSSQRVRDVTGTMAMDLLTRIFGLIVAAIAVQFILEGFAEVFPQWITPESAIHDELPPANG